MSKAAMWAGTSNAQQRTPADELRQALAQLENCIGRLKHSTRAEVAAMPPLFDQAQALLQQLAERGVDLGPERARWETLCAQFDRNGALFVRKSGGAAALRAARQAVLPDTTAWWWFMDERLAAARKQRFTRILRGGALGLLALLALALVYRLFFAPDPELLARLDRTDAAQRALLAGDLAQALVETEAGLTLAPSDPALLTLQGVILETQGDAPAAETAFAAARAAYDTEENFLVQRSQLYLMSGQPGAALADAEEILVLNPESPLGYLQRGHSHEALGEILAAIHDYERAAELAEAANDAQLVVTARALLASAYMQAPMYAVTPTE